MSPMKSALLAASLLAAAGGMAMAQGRGPNAGAGPTYDPAQLPAMKGNVAQYTLTPRGDVDGFLLADGTEVHVNPMMSTALVFAVKPGDAVTIHGLKAKALPMVAAASVTNDATGATVTGRMGGHGEPGRGATIEAEGVVKAALHEPRGDVNGVLLDNGTVIRMPAGEARRLAAQLAVGQKLFVRGTGVTSPLGKVVMAQQIGADKSKLTDVAMPRMHDGKMAGKMGGMMGRHPGMAPPSATE